MLQATNAEPEAHKEWRRLKRSRDNTRIADAVLVGIFLVLLLTSLLISQSFSITTVTLAVSGLMCILGIYVSINKNRILFTSAFLFNFVFFSIAPLHQISVSFDPILLDEVVTSTSAIFVAASNMILLFSALATRQIKTHKPNPVVDLDPRPMIILSLFCSIVAISILGSNLFSSREAISLALEAESGSVGLPYYTLIIIKPLAFYTSCMALWLSRGSFSKWAIIAIVAVIFSCIINNPTITPRYLLFSLATSAVLFVYGFSSARLYIYYALVGILLSPLFQIFRRIDTDFGVSQYRQYSNMFAHMDYELFSILCHAIYYINSHGIMWGRNILGAVLFFVPRSIWADKPMPSASYLFETISLYRGLWNDNLATPLIAELLLAFGIGGVLAGFPVLAWAMIKVENRACNRPRSIFALFAGGLAGLMFLLLRGQLMIAWGAIFSQALACLLMAFAFYIWSGLHKRGTSVRRHRVRPGAGKS